MKLAWFTAIIFFVNSPTTGIAADLSTYHVAHQYPLAGDGSWDDIAIDTSTHRLFISHGNRIEVLDTDSGKLVGRIDATPGVHGAAIASDLRRGFTSNGGDSSVTIFDSETLSPIGRVNVSKPDFILYDAFTHRVLPLSEKTTVLDAKTGKILGEVDLGGSPESAISNGEGKVYLSLKDKEAVAVLDVQRLAILRRFPIDHCTAPGPLSLDNRRHRLFVGCRNGQMVALDSESGSVVGRALMCSGADSSAYDPEAQRILESCAEGVISVIRQWSQDYYLLEATVPTQLYAKTMAYDPATKKIYTAAADLETIPNPDAHAGGRYLTRPTPGTFHVLVLQPAE